MTIPSKCHETDKEWMPEPGSLEYRTRWDGWLPCFTTVDRRAFQDVIRDLRESQMRMEAAKKIKAAPRPPNRKNWKIKKFHHEFSLGCATMTDPRSIGSVRLRTLSLEAFRTLPERLQCRNCALLLGLD